MQTTASLLPALIRTDAGNTDFRALVALLDADLAVRNGAEQQFYGQFNGLAPIRHVVLAVLDGRALACGAFKEFGPGVAEIKRMFTHPDGRRRGLAAAVLAELETWCCELGYTACVLETGVRHEEAIALYQKTGYTIIPNYPPYTGVDGSVCLRKVLGV
ncbi:GNAT family N-acetyltransferase [Flaviaesturariibacter amylovorans]|uniref:GNAT family N-acetyltransferase n=1 Tax=Flaviaesturariibacter amylovorans TaxID=1084520 RepID=A0ABP8G8V8_9BACT